jgi:HK97 family phage major capsid protein
MADGTPNDAVAQTADEIITSEAFQSKLGDTIEAIVAKAMKPKEEEKGTAEKLFAPASQHAKPKIKNLIGAAITALYKGKNDLERTVAWAKARWGDGNEVQKHFQKALTSATSGGAVEMVQTTVAAEVIEALRPASVVRSSGAQIVPNPTGTLQIPRVSTGASISWVGEATASNATQQVFDTVTLTRKKGMVKVPVTKELVMFATPDAEQAIADDVVAAMAAGTDAAYIRGASGGQNPTGIRYQIVQANVIPSTGNAASAVETDIGNLLEGVRGNNIPLTPETGVFWMNSRSFTYLEKLRDSNGNLIYPELRMETPRLMRYRVLITNNIPNNITLSGQSPTGDESEVYFGRGPSILIADAADMSLEVLENVAYTNSSGSLESGVDLDTVLVKAMLLTDIALRHDSAWAVLEGVQWGNGSTT